MGSSVYEIITGKIVEALEAGVIPWRKPWNVKLGTHCNFITKKPYRGINAFVLALSGYSCPYWATYKQIEEKGGHVRKGEKSTQIVYWNTFEKDDENTDETGKKKRIGFYRYFNVFNLAQADGIATPEETKTDKPFNAIETAENIVGNMPNSPEIFHDSNQACYHPKTDKIHMPKREDFHSPEEYYSTLFHEMTHATGHETRLSRKGVTEATYFGSDPYANEELVAELGAAFLCAECGIVQKTLDNSASYIKSWLSRLKQDSKLIFTASSQAQKAADFILGEKQEEITE